MIVVDTNVTSELMRSAPAAEVLAWLAAQSPSDLYTSAITVAEIRYGIERLAAGRRKGLLAAAASEVFSTFAERVLAFDAPAAMYYPDIVLGRERSGSPISGFDAQIACICRDRGAALATRNVRDFAGVGIDLVDPSAS